MLKFRDEGRAPATLDERWLADLLAAEPVPDSTGALHRTVADIRAGANVRDRRAARTPAIGSWRGPRAVALGAFAAVAVVAVSLTPPGRAATGAIGELVGIGDPPTIDHAGTIDEGGAGIPERPGATTLVGAPEGPEVVIGTGVAPGGASFEVAAYRTNALDGSALVPGSGEMPHLPGLAVAVEFPGTNGQRLVPGNLSMAPLDRWGAPVEGAYGPDGAGAQKGLGAEAAVLVVGDAPAEAARVEVTYTEPATGEVKAAPAHLFQVDRSLLEEIGVDTEPFGYYVAFLPQGEGDSFGDITETVRARVFDAEGGEL